ncbi:hypothetical protein Pyn_15428 [Prunus yedoensis var. nudiflora]|uniref:Uncharacterized protein n=1 Tax=Prunus yedoensis var. nudiflora TaxID=2094558 RepID=A0A314YRR0_PRUYE|nr:hypothetical protein Pyn_15428 [Prunus yedoensis var. nudiflora]
MAFPAPNPEDSMSCFDLSKNDSYLISTPGGMISIFDMTTFKKVMPPPPAATCLAFHSRDDGIAAIVMDNSTIVIYNLHSNEIFVWEKQRSKLLQIPDGNELRSLSDTYIQIHQNELHLLAINKTTHLAVYEVKELACV